MFLSQLQGQEREGRGGREGWGGVKRAGQNRSEEKEEGEAHGRKSTDARSDANLGQILNRRTESRAREGQDVRKGHQFTHNPPVHPACQISVEAHVGKSLREEDVKPDAPRGRHRRRAFLAPALSFAVSDALTLTDNRYYGRR